MIALFLSNNRIAVFLEQGKKIKSQQTRERQTRQHSKHVISSVSVQIATFRMEMFCQYQLENHFGR